MNLNINTLFASFPSGLAQGLLWGIMALGLYITFRMLNFADMTVDGTFTTGGAVTVMLIIAGWQPWIAVLVAFFAGLLACHRYSSYKTWNSRHTCRYSDTVCSMVCQPSYHGILSQ